MARRNCATRRSAGARAFEAAHAEAVEFYAWLQWLADEQLGAAQRLARELGMAIGLYGDYAVGVNPSGAETWSDQALYRKGAGVGAPPDALALKGQDWGIPPQDPNVLVAEQYRPFRHLIAANMRHFGALRLDHVMALFRQWWVPVGLGATDGGYVHYPLDDLMSVLALESERHACLVVGEDLGTVPPEMSHAMAERAVYSYRVLLFEKSADGSFHRPDEYPRRAIATVTTHDLPTLNGYWSASDIELRQRLHLYPSDEVRQRVQRERVLDRAALLAALECGGPGAARERPRDRCLRRRAVCRGPRLSRPQHLRAGGAAGRGPGRHAGSGQRAGDQRRARQLAAQDELPPRRSVRPPAGTAPARRRAAGTVPAGRSRQLIPAPLLPPPPATRGGGGELRFCNARRPYRNAYVYRELPRIACHPPPCLRSAVVESLHFLKPGDYTVTKLSQPGSRREDERLTYLHLGRRSALSLAVAVALGLPGAVLAQDAPAADAELEEIVVTGIRAGIKQAIEVKADSGSIVEAISAEDIGKLPDTSIAESISRLPGITSQRAEGRASAISLRGTDPGFTTALLNGREQVSTGDNRSVEFDQYPSELINQVVVYKTPDAQLVGQGLAGTIDLRTVRPLDYGRQAVVLNLRGETNSHSDGDLGADHDDTGYRASLSYIDQFMDGKVGVAFGYARLSSPLATKGFGTYEPWRPMGDDSNPNTNPGFPPDRAHHRGHEGAHGHGRHRA